MDTLEQFINYIKVEKRYSRHTVRAYNDDISQFKTFYLNQYSGSDLLLVTQTEIREWVIQTINHTISSRSLRRKIASLNAFYKFCLRNRLISTNPVEGIILPRIDKKLPEFIKETALDTIFEEKQFENNFSGIRNRFILELFYATGMRLSELINLKDDSYNDQKAELRILGKRNKERIVPLTNNIIRLLSDYMKARSEKFSQLSHNYLIVNDSGAPAYSRMIQRIVRTHLNKGTTLDQKSPHILRHTFATHMLNNGADLNAVKELLGHANLAATEIYTHNTYEKLKSIYKQAHPRA
jgi:integrase/recombinase XerC